MTDNIATKALIINLGISQWSGRKLDRQVTKETNDAHNAADDAGRFNKLLIDKNALGPIQTVANSARLYVYKQTLPWGDNGDRVLMASRYFDFMAKMREFELEFKAAVAKLVTEYNVYVAKAQFRLNSMFKAEDYPAVNEIEGKFAFTVGVRPVPVAGDFRVEMGDEVVAEIKEQISKDTDRVVSEAMRTVWAEVGTTMSHLYGKLSDPKAIFRTSTIDNIDELIDRIPHLNLTDDPTLETFRRELKTNLSGYKADELRKNPVKRSDAAAETKRIMDQFGGMWG